MQSTPSVIYLCAHQGYIYIIYKVILSRIVEPLKGCNVNMATVASIYIADWQLNQVNEVLSTRSVISVKYHNAIFNSFLEMLIQ